MHGVAGQTLRQLTPAAVVLVALPGWAVKQCVNVVQLRTAAAQLIAYDMQRAGDTRKGRKA